VNKIIFLFLLFTCISFSACAGNSVYTGPWTGLVIDAETKQPIEGAAVIAIWLKAYSMPSGPKDSYLDSTEATTDKEGKFYIPEKKYKNIPQIHEVYGPRITIFKPGYGCFPGYEFNPASGTLRKKMFNEGMKSIIELPKVKDKTLRDKIFRYPIEDILGYQIPAKDFNKLPHFRELYNEEAKYLGYPER